LRAVATLLLALAPTFTFAADGTAPQKRAAADFLGYLGVATHTAWTGTSSYGRADGTRDIAKVERLLAFLGVSRIRDGVGNAWMLSEYRELGRQGIRLNLLISTEKNTEPVGLQIAGLATLAPFLIGIEGPNEPDLRGETFEGLNGPAASRALQQRIFALVRGNPTLNSVPVVETSIGHAENFKDYAGMAHADLGNMHSYFFDFGKPIAAELPERMAQVQTIAPGKPMVTTETGWPTKGSPGGYVTPPAQAILVLDVLLDEFKAGVLQAYVYQLIDVPEATDYYGLFLEDGTPKPAAVALHNLTRILADAKRPTAPRAAAVTVAGLPATGQSLLLAKSDGSDWLVLWNELPVWDAAASRVLAPPAALVTVRAPAASRACLYDPLAGTAGTPLGGADDGFAVAVTTHPVIISLQTKSVGGCSDRRLRG
jgi:hypothetical protein